MYKSVLKGGINKTVRHRDFPLHKHNEDELYVCFGGSATDVSEGKAKSVSSGDIYLRKKGVTHSQSDIKNFFCCVFQFDKEELLRRANEMGLLKKEGFISLFLKDGETSGLFVDAKTVKYAEIISDIIKEEKDLEIRDILFLNLLAVICSRKEAQSFAPYESIEEVVRYIEHNYDKSLNLEALAKRSRYSRRHFTRLFREVCKASPMEYLNAVRIKNASDLLVRSDISVMETARLCGFEDNNLFSRRFKAFYKKSPTEYRLMYKAK